MKPLSLKFTYSTTLRTMLVLACPAALIVASQVHITAQVKAAAGAQTAKTAGDEAFFESRIRPLLLDKCASCHGDKQQKGALRLDTAEGLNAGGSRGIVIDPLKLAESRLLQAVSYSGDLKMPPAGKLSAVEIADLTKWVNSGAAWPAAQAAKPSAKTNGRTAVVTAEHRNFWSFRPVKRPTPPRLKNGPTPLQPIDRFVFAKLEARGLKPAVPTDKRSLIRRAYFDLIGLPPTPDEVEAFVADRSPSAFAKVVDHLLTLPQYGERWGRHWLDVVRYADSNGLDENKAFGHAWRYRDWVIAAHNRDLPYDEFIREQIAGDLMKTDDPQLRNDRLTATGLLVLGPKVLAEQDKPKFVMDIVDEQIEVVSKAVMGLTVACARCHDHKFDPIPTKDYYALAGIFKSTRTMKDLGFVSNWNERELVATKVSAAEKEHEEQVARITSELTAARQAANDEVLASLRRDGEKYIRAGIELARQPGVIPLAEADRDPVGAKRLFIEAENFQRGNVNKDFETYGKGIGVIHNVGLPDVAEWDINLPNAGNYRVEMRYASAEHRPVKFLVNGKVVATAAAGEITGSFQPDGQRWFVIGTYDMTAGKNTLRIESNVPIPHFDKLMIVPAPIITTGTVLTADQIAQKSGLNVDLVRVFAARLGGSVTEDEALRMRKQMEENKGPFALPEMPERFYAAGARNRVKAAEETLAKLNAKATAKPVVMAVDEDRTEDVRVHLRGSTLTLGETAPRGFLTVLQRTSTAAMPAKQSGRLELAQWMTSPDHPLTARVEVNRVWQGHFGEGIVRTPENFGFLGDRPVHAELLDWLASEFMSPTGCNWSVKKLHRLIMLSETYRMSSTNNAKAEILDPENRLMWRYERRRLEAEPIRDAMLAVAGTLDPTMGGTLLNTPNNDYVTNDQSNNGARYNALRRSVYLPIIRNALFDMFQAYDVGDPSIVIAHRSTTTVATQALWALNSPFVMEQARAFASLILKTKGSDAELLDRAYRRAYGRPPTAEEVKRSLKFLEQFAAALESKEKDSRTRTVRAWEGLCQVILASNEFVYLN